MATKLQCEICGGKLVGKPGGIFECESCGTEYSTEWAKAKIQEITGTVKVEGTVEVTGKVQVEGGTVQVDTSANKDALLKRAFMMLEEANWEKADELLEQVLNIDPECGEAYLGKLMAELKANTCDTLGNLTSPFDNLLNYQRALRFSSDRKDELTRYNEIARNRWYELQYAEADDMLQKRTADALQKAENLFAQLGNYRDAEQKASFCKAQMEKRQALRSQYRAYLPKIGMRVSPSGPYGIKADGTVLEPDMELNHDGNSNSISTWDHIAYIDYHYPCTFGLRTDGTVLATHEDDDESMQIYQEVTSWRDIIAIAHSSDCTFGIKADGTIETTSFRDNPRYYKGQDRVAEWENVVSIVAGTNHTVALKADGTVVATRIIEKVLDRGQSNVDDWTNITAIAAGADHTVGLLADGTVVATKITNKLADKGQSDVSSWKGIVSVIAGPYHTVGLKSDGTVVAVGDNRNGQCEVSCWRDIAAIDADVLGRCTFGLKSDGTVVATKYTGDKEDYYGQDQVSDWRDIVAIAAGSRCTYGIKEDGTVVATKYIGNEIWLKHIDQVDSWKLFESVDEIISIIQENEMTIERRRTEAMRRKQAEIEETERRKSEEIAKAERQRLEAEQQRQAELARKRKDLSERLASVKQCKQAAETEFANLKGLFIGRRRKELEAQIADLDRQIVKAKAELKDLQ